jgi:hypothetical protein
MTSTLFLLAFAANLVSVEGFVPATRGTGKPTFTTTSLKAFDIAGTTSAIDAFYHTQPYAAAFMTCSFKASAADLVVQRQNDDDVSEEKKPLDFDFQRNVGFLLYGGIYQGCVQEYLTTISFLLYSVTHSRG